MLKKLFTAACIMSLGYSYPQTSEAGNYELFTREILNSSFGYLNCRINLPLEYGGSSLSSTGISYTHFYEMSKIGSIPVDNDNEIGFYLNGEFKLGFGAGKKILIPGFPVSSSYVKFYSATADFFSLYLTPEYTTVMQNGHAFTFQLGINLLNIGGTVAMPEHGVVSRHLLGTINLVPLGFAPSVFFDFGRSGLGLRAYFNLTDFLSYNIARTTIYGDEFKGIKSFDSVINRSDFQIVFVF